MEEHSEEYNKGWANAWEVMEYIMTPIDLLSEEEFKFFKSLNGLEALKFIKEKASFQKSTLYNKGIGLKEAHLYYDLYKDKEWKNFLH